MIKLVFKVLAFAFICLWILSYLATGFMAIPALTEIVSNYWYLVGGWVPTFLRVWFVLTVVITSALVAWFGFRFIGKWERK